MKYYRVKQEYDNKPICKNVSGYRAISFFLVGNELYTPTEKAKYSIPDNVLETIHISKKRTYFSFGARFERG